MWCIGAFQRNRTNCLHERGRARAHTHTHTHTIEKEREIIETGSCDYRVQEVPVCHSLPYASSVKETETGDPGKLVVSFSLSPKPWESESQFPRADENGCPGSGREHEFCVPPPFFSIWAFNGWPPTLMSLPIQMLVCSGNFLTDKPKCNVWPALWASLSPIKLTTN